jgi:hypothetical protein
LPYTVNDFTDLATTNTVIIIYQQIVK